MCIRDSHDILRSAGDICAFGPLYAVITGKDAEIAGDVVGVFIPGIDQRELIDGPAVIFTEINR